MMLVEWNQLAFNSFKTETMAGGLDKMRPRSIEIATFNQVYEFLIKRFW